MKKLLLSLAIVVGAALLAAPVARAEIVLGASIGQSDLKAPGFSDDDSGAQFYAGFRFLKFVGFEVEYTDFGKFEQGSGGSADSREITRADLFVLGVIPIGRFEIFGKAGYGYWDADFTTGAVKTSDDGSDPAFGVGFAVKFVKILALRVEYEEFDIDGADKLSMASIGLDFRF